jgi:hypothetical protein
MRRRITISWGFEIDDDDYDPQSYAQSLAERLGGPFAADDIAVTASAPPPPLTVSVSIEAADGAAAQAAAEKLRGLTAEQLAALLGATGAVRSRRSPVVETSDASPPSPLLILLFLILLVILLILLTVLLPRKYCRFRRGRGRSVRCQTDGWARVDPSGDPARRAIETQTWSHVVERGRGGEGDTLRGHGASPSPGLSRFSIGRAEPDYYKPDRPLRRSPRPEPPPPLPPPLPAPPPYIADRPLYYAPEPEAPPPPVVEPERDVLREAMGRRELGLKTRSFDQDILSAGGGLQSSVHQADDDMPDMALTRR